MHFEIKNRWSAKVQFECELEVKFETQSYGIQLGAAIKKAYKDSADLRGAVLSGAALSGADLSDADLRDADLRGADLRGADLRDADLRDADLRDADLRDADLRGAVLSGAALSGADLSDASLSGADLSGAVLRGADLSGADLSDASLSGAVLRDADLGGGLEGVPSIPDIHKAVYEAASKPKALEMSSWHSCNTTHCRAGWVVTLAGDGGRALEWALGTPAAAALIYMRSDPELEKIPDFHEDNETALADMKRLAAGE